MIFKTYGRYCKVQGCVSKSNGSTSSRLPLFFKGPDKLAGGQVPLLGASNVLAVALGPSNAPVPAFAGFWALPRVYLYDEMQNIIRIVMEAKTAATKSPQKRLLKAGFLDIYRGDNHMACYNFCQECKGHFATAGAKELNRILFIASFFWDCISFCWQQHKEKLDNKTLVLPILEKFKAFICKSLGDSKTFVIVSSIKSNETLNTSMRKLWIGPSTSNISRLC